MKNILLTIALLITPLYSASCDCTFKGYKDATVVFNGNVFRITKINGRAAHYEIVVKLRAWDKGDQDKWLKKNDSFSYCIINVPCINDGTWDSCCGVKFELGEHFAIYAFVKDGRLWTNRCWATHKM